MNTKNAALTRRSFLGGAAVFATSLSFSPFAFAAESDAIAAEAQAARDALGQMQIQLGQASDAYFTALEARDEAQAKVDSASATIKENTKKISQLQGNLSVRVHDMYTDDQASFLDVFLGSTSFDAFVRNWDALTAMNESDANLVRDTKVLRQQNEMQKKVLLLQQDEATRQMVQAEQARNNAESLVAQYQAQVDALDAKVAAALEQEQQQAYEAAQGMVEQMDEALAQRQVEEISKGDTTQGKSEQSANVSAQKTSSAGNASSANNGVTSSPAANTSKANTAGSTSPTTQKQSTSTTQSKQNSATSSTNAGKSNATNTNSTSTSSGSGTTSTQQQSTQKPTASQNATQSSNSSSVSKPATQTQTKPQTQTQSTPSGSNPYGSAILAAAQYQVGVWYVWGGTSAYNGAGARDDIKRYGLDCSGLTSHCWLAATGKYIGRTSGAQFASATWKGSPSQAQVGDVLYCNGHVGICAAPGGTAYIHAPTTGQKVTYQLSKYWNPWTHALRW